MRDYYTNTRLFPIQDGLIKAVPWDAIAAHRQQAETNHMQSVERLAERGGLSVDEACAVIQDRPWRDMSRADARIQLMSLVKDKEPS